MKKLLSYNDFLLMESNCCGDIIIFPGRFQVLHNGHLSSFKKAYDEFKIPVVPIQITSNNKKSPIPRTVLSKINKDIVGDFDFIGDFLIFPEDRKTTVSEMIKYVKELGYNPIGLACGSDREFAYKKQIEYVNSDKSDIFLKQPFMIKCVDDRFNNPLSGSVVRDFIKNNDFDKFKELTPNTIHKYWDELKKYLY